MKGKAILTVALLLFVAAGLGYMAAGSFRPAPPDPAAGGTETRNVAFYFHGSVRCPTCNAIERQSEEAIRAGFPAWLEEGTLAWEVVNFDEPANEHFVEDFQLSHQSVVLAEMEGGRAVRWKNLDRVWDLVHEPAEFEEYITSETAGFFTAGG